LCSLPIRSSKKALSPRTRGEVCSRSPFPTILKIQHPPIPRTHSQSKGLLCSSLSEVSNGGIASLVLLPAAFRPYLLPFHSFKQAPFRFRTSYKSPPPPQKKLLRQADGDSHLARFLSCPHMLSNVSLAIARPQAFEHLLKSSISINTFNLVDGISCLLPKVKQQILLLDIPRASSLFMTMSSSCIHLLLSMPPDYTSSRSTHPLPWIEQAILDMNQSCPIVRHNRLIQMLIFDV
jgi:hypothetical protein